MRLDPAQQIAGIPILVVREVLRRSWRHDEIRISTAAALLSELGLGSRRAGPLLRALEEQGFLERVRLERAPRVQAWDVTRSGAALTWAMATKPIRRSTADRLLAAFLERVRALEGWEHPYAFGVRQVIVYGSYLTDRDDLGDVDLGVEFLPRFENGKKSGEYQRARARQARRSGRRWHSLLQEIGFAENEVWGYLRARKRSLSLIDLRIQRGFVESVPHRIIYTRPDSDVSLP